MIYYDCVRMRESCTGEGLFAMFSSLLHSYVYALEQRCAELY